MVFRKTIILVACTFLMFGLASAQDLQQDAGITPDSPLWGLDKALEQIMYRISSQENKAIYGLKIAEERLSEIQLMNNLNSSEGVQLAEKERQRILNRLEIDSKNLNAEIRQKIQERLELHISNEKKIREGLQSHIQDKIKDNNEILERIKKQGEKN